MSNLIKFVAGAQEKINKSYANSALIPVLEIRKGRKYTKIVKVDYPGAKHGSVYAFINESTGSVFKPASWAAPAKHVRGNINASDYGVSCATPYGIVYLR